MSNSDSKEHKIGSRMKDLLGKNFSVIVQFSPFGQEGGLCYGCAYLGVKEIDGEDEEYCMFARTGVDYQCGEDTRADERHIIYKRLPTMRVQNFEEEG